MQDFLSPSCTTQRPNINLRRKFLLLSPLLVKINDIALYILGMYFPSVMLRGDHCPGLQANNPILYSPLEPVLLIQAIRPRSLQHPQLWAFVTAGRDSREIPSAAVAAQMSWNTFETEEVSWPEVVSGQLCLFIHFSHIQHVFSVFEPLPHLHCFSTWQETNHVTALHHPDGGGKSHLLSSRCLCKHPVLPIQPHQTSHSHWNRPCAQGRFVDES